ncbi:thyroxine-binding globulin-like [Eublepharis macularius]|uniref:Thyroxine-binding globulin-like n=1 Tax=Eublepharis macularius TaxID=481883 RepID=A0AA97KSB5_EUBMA|nr:thyroxine-binding globulin-like [Eublepharis macularius]
MSGVLKYMWAMLYISLLLFGLQFQCYHLSGFHDVQDNHQNTDSTEEWLYPPFKRECTTNFSALLKIAPYNANFAFRLYKQMSSDSDDKNIFFSPVSISTAFAMLALRAKSQTQTQIYNAFAFNLSEIEENEIHKGFCQLIFTFNFLKQETSLKIGNALFIDKSLKVLPTFLKDAKTLYQAERFSTNFLNSTEAKQQIYSYMKNKIYGGHLRKVKDFSAHTVMVLVNYMASKISNWRDEFHSRLTTEGSFLAYGNTTVKLNFMRKRTMFNHVRDEELSCLVVEVLHSKDAVAWFILPDEGKLKHVESSLVKEDMNKWRSSFQKEQKYLWIPKFSLSVSYDVKTFLQRLGMTDVFNRHADLSGFLRIP